VTTRAASDKLPKPRSGW